MPKDSLEVQVRAFFKKRKEVLETDEEYKCNLQQMKDCLSSAAWQDIRDYIGLMLEQRMSDLKTIADRDIILRTQGAIEEIETILALPEIMIDDLSYLIKVDEAEEALKEEEK